MAEHAGGATLLHVIVSSRISIVGSRPGSSTGNIRSPEREGNEREVVLATPDGLLEKEKEGSEEEGEGW